MSKHQIHVERMLGKRVFALNGRSVGRLQEIRASVDRNNCYVKEFIVGSYGMFERLSAMSIGRAIYALFHSDNRSHGYLVPWNELDLSDPDRPRLRCEVNALTLLRD